MVNENIGKAEMSKKLIDFVVLPFSEPGMINDRNLFSRALNHFIGLSQPVQIAGFIGQGGKDHLGKSDLNLIDKYSRLQEEITRYYSFGTEVNLIGADIHSIENGIESHGYLELMQERALLSGFNWLLLSELYREKGLVPPDLWDVGQFYGDEKSQEYLAWNSIPPENRASMVKGANRHAGKGFDDEITAFKYFLMRRQEESLFVPDWQDYLFIINGSEELAKHTFSTLIPQMYWYDTRHHGSKNSRDLNKNLILPPPWFRND